MSAMTLTKNVTDEIVLDVHMSIKQIMCQERLNMVYVLNVTILTNRPTRLMTFMKMFESLFFIKISLHINIGKSQYQVMALYKFRISNSI